MYEQIHNDLNLTQSYHLIMGINGTMGVIIEADLTGSVISNNNKLNIK